MNFDVKVQNVSVKYKKFSALNDLSFQLEPNKIYGFIGRNGAGKTTFLSLLASFREPTSGELFIGGEKPFENKNIMPHVSFNYQTDYADDPTKVKELLEDEAYCRPNFDMEYAQHLVKRFKLPLNKAVNSLSTGMQSAVNVTLGLASRAPITIFDEAYQGMDAPTREIFYKELLEDQERYPRTIILSTHLVSEMDYLFDEVIIIDKGKLVVQATYDEFVAKGTSITGQTEYVDQFTEGMEILNTQKLGNTKRVTIYGELSEEQIFDATRQNLDLGPVPLQDLFIHLTNDGEET